MIGDLRPYPAYRDSGVAWLGDVPQHWRVQRLWTVVWVLASNVDKNASEAERPVRLCNYVDVYKNERIREHIPFMQATATADEIEHFRLRHGDVLITKDSETWDDIAVPALAEYTAPDLLCGYHLALLRPRAQRIIGGYLLRALQSRLVASQLHVGANGVTRFGLSRSAIKNVWVPLPPLAEQAAIVRFLDHADGRIQRAIRAKKRLIALLIEQKAAIIHRAVTRGLDPTVPLKPSGVEWLGDVPAHWEVVALRRMSLSRCDGPFGSGLKSSHYAEDGVGVVRLQNIGHGEYRHGSPAFISPSHYASLGDHSVEEGDLLIAGLGDDQHPAGRACAAPEGMGPAMVKADCFRFRLDRSRLDPEFAALHLTATAVGAAAHLSRGATRQRTNLQAAASRQICVPPLGEQTATVTRLANETRPLRVLVANAQKEISLLQEFRTRLIADVVTGELDVRAAAASLPAEAEKDEPYAEDDLGEDDGGEDSDEFLAEAAV